MQNGTDTALRLMIVDDSVEDAEAIVSATAQRRHRRASLAPGPADELQAMLGGAGHRPGAGRAAVQAACRWTRCCSWSTASGKDLPVIAVADRVDEASLSQAFAAGVRGIALRTQAAAAAAAPCAPNGPTSKRAARCAGSKRRCARPSAAATR